MTGVIHLSSFPRHLSPWPLSKCHKTTIQNTLYKIHNNTNFITNTSNIKHIAIQTQHNCFCVPFVICPNVLMSKCSFPSPSFVQTFRVTTKKEENHISTEFLRMMEIVKFNIPPSLTSVSTTSLNAKAFKSKLFRRLTFDTRSYLILVGRYFPNPINREI